MTTTDTMPDAEVAEFLDLARSANVHFEIVNDRLHMRMVRPNWDMWKPCRHMLDEIGQARIEAFVRGEARERHAVDRWTHVSADRLHLAAEARRSGCLERGFFGTRARHRRAEVPTGHLASRIHE